MFFVFCRGSTFGGVEGLHGDGINPIQQNQAIKKKSLRFPYCWWFRNPANQLIWRIPPLFTRFYTSQMVVWDFFHPQYHSLRFSYGSLKVPLRFPFSKKTTFPVPLKLMRVHTSYTEIFDVNTHVTLRMWCYFHLNLPSCDSTTILTCGIWGTIRYRTLRIHFWRICLHGWLIFYGRLIGKCTSPMDPYGSYPGFVIWLDTSWYHRKPWRMLDVWGIMLYGFGFQR